MKSNEILCASCRQIKKQGEFAMGYGAQAGRKVAVCKECCTAKLEKYENYVGRVGAFWLLAAELGLPFIQQVYDMAYHASISIKKDARRPDLVDLYVKKLNLLDTKYNGFWDSDTMLDDILNEHKEKNVDPKTDLALMERRWGKFPEDFNEAYSFLEDMFDAYTEGIPNMDANLTNRYRDLCKAEYQKRKADESGDVQEIAKAQSNLNGLLKLLKLDDFKANNVDPREKFIDRLCWMIEETEPAEEEDRKKYADIAGFEKAYHGIMRSMRNLIAGTKDYPEIPREEQ